MRSKSLHIASTIRFRRWSRVGYAIFCSLSSNISIGSLSVSVSDKTLQKSNNINSKKADFATLEWIGSEKEDFELEGALQLIKLASLTEVSFDNKVACNLTTSYIINSNG